MFYQDEQIDKLKICPICKFNFDDPRVLPCGHTVCFECIKSKPETEKFKCKLCNKINCIENDEFPSNILIKKLLETIPIKVHRGRAFENFKKELDALEDQLSNFKLKYASVSDYIKEYCNSIRNEIQICVDSCIYYFEQEDEQRFQEQIQPNSKLEKLELKQSELLEKVYNYEKDCLKKSGFDVPMSDLENEIKAKISYYQNKVFDFQLKESQFYDFKKDITKCKQSIFDRELALKNNVLNNNTIIFKPYKNPDEIINIGDVVFRPVKILPDKIDFLEFSPTDFKSNLKVVKHTKNDSFYIFYKDQNRYLKFQIIDSNGIELKKAGTLLDRKKISKFSVKIFKDELYFWVHLYKSTRDDHLVHGRFVFFRHIFIKFDSNLDCDSLVEINYVPIEFSVSENEIICINNDFKVFFLDHYFRKMRELNISCHISKLFLNENKIYILNNESFSVLNQSDGSLIEKFDIGGLDFLLNDNDKVIIYSKKDFSLYDLASKTVIQKESAGCDVSIIHSNEINNFALLYSDFKIGFW
jgi:hypothetical protein